MFVRLLPAVLISSTISLAGDQVPLSRDGRPLVYLDTAPGSAQESQPAVADLLRCFKKLTGAELPLGKAHDLIPLRLGEAARFQDLPFPVPDLGEEGFLLKVSPQGIYLIGGTAAGTQHAVYTLLRDLGCRWIMPGDIGECIPARPSLSLPAGERIEKPDFRYRIIWYAYGCSPLAAERLSEWYRRNRLARPDVRHGHNLTSTLARKAPFSKRPELYSLTGGKRTVQQICTSNPEAVLLVTESIREFLAANPGIESYSLCPDDNSDFCECGGCRALDTGHLDRGGKPGIADRYQIFLNQVLEGLKPTHPHVQVTTYSYNVNHTDPPQKTPVDRRTCIFATTSAFCAAHGIGHETCSSRQDFKKLLAEWIHLTPNVYVYEYDPIPFSGGLPWPMWREHMREMEIYRKLGVKGVSFEGQNSWAPYFPNYYIAGQMLWNSRQDGESLFDDMLQAFFLETAPAMKGYYDGLADAIDSFPHQVDWGLVQYPEIFTPEAVRRVEKALAGAIGAASSPIVKQRLDMVRLSHEEMASYLAIRDPQRARSADEYKARVASMRNSIDQLAAGNEDYLLAQVAHRQTWTAVGEFFGREMGFINRWQICGPFDNTGMEGHDKIFPPEQRVDLSASYTGKKGRAVRWKENQTPEWKGYVDLRSEFDEKEWVCAYAACWIDNPGKATEAELRMGSNDSIKVFLDGKEIWNKKVDRIATVDEDRVRVTLPRGTTTILLKIGQTAKNWGFYFRLIEPGTENPLQGISISTAAPRQ
ncbi:MAG: DUF4838 domain-containing protein [Planctomycetes bacterium]|nr:DUF4838 domain-containing protein [Planctomycetota bacterium]